MAKAYALHHLTKAITSIFLISQYETPNKATFLSERKDRRKVNPNSYLSIVRQCMTICLHIFRSINY